MCSSDLNFLISNVISFRGIKRYRLEEREDGMWGEELEDLLYSRDPNFRPSDTVVGADGALYVSDWHNPHIAHSIPNMRSELRDHTHGRIYRITADDRPLQSSVPIHNEEIASLLSLLNHPVDGVRHRVRVELSGRETERVIAGAGALLEQLRPEEDQRLMLEILWLHQQHHVENRELLDQLLSASDPRIRTAAERVLHDWSVMSPGELFAEGGSISSAETDAALTRSADMESGIELDLSELAVAELEIRAIPHRMLYDVSQFTVRSGQQVRLTFINPDYMPHNILIVEPGSADEVAEDAIRLDAEGFSKQFVPDNPNVLYSSGLLNVDEQELIEFKAPEQSGAYEFICSFPGHADTMRGIMVVL